MDNNNDNDPLTLLMNMSKGTASTSTSDHASSTHHQPILQSPPLPPVLDSSNVVNVESIPGPSSSTLTERTKRSIRRKQILQLQPNRQYYTNEIVLKNDPTDSEDSDDDDDDEEDGDDDNYDNSVYHRGKKSKRRFYNNDDIEDEEDSDELDEDDDDDLNYMPRTRDGMIRRAKATADKIRRSLAKGDKKVKKTKVKRQTKKKIAMKSKHKKRDSTTSLRGHAKQPVLSLEEQQELELPAEIDMRNVYATHGLTSDVGDLGDLGTNSTLSLSKPFRKHSNDIATFSIGEARFKYAHGKVAEAYQLLSQLLRICPDTLEAYDALSDIYQYEKNYQKALEVHLLAVRFARTSAVRWFKIAEFAEACNLHKSAVNFYDRAIKLAPRNLSYFIKKCNLLERTRQYQLAVKCLERALEQHKQQQIAATESAVNEEKIDDTQMDEHNAYSISISLVFRIATLQARHLGQHAEALNLVEPFLQREKIESNPRRLTSFILLYLAEYFDILLANGQHYKVIIKCVQHKLIDVQTDEEGAKVLATIRSLSTTTTDSANNRSMIDEAMIQTANQLVQVIVDNRTKLKFATKITDGDDDDGDEDDHNQNHDYENDQMIGNMNNHWTIIIGHVPLSETFLTLQTKFITAMIYLKQFNFIEPFFEAYLSLPAHLYDSLYPTMIKAFISVEDYTKALKLIHKLIDAITAADTPTPLSSGGVSKYWYWCGLCQSKLGQLDESILSFENAIQHDRNNFDAIKELSHICNLAGDPERALDNLNLLERNNQSSIDFKLLHSRCNLLYICKRWEEFISIARLLLGSEMLFFDPAEMATDMQDFMNPIINASSLVRMSKRMYRRLQKRNTDKWGDGGRTRLTGGRLSEEQFFDLWKRAVFVLLNYTQQHDEAVRWALSGFLCTYIDRILLPVAVCTFRCCLDAKYYPYTFEIGRFLLKEYPQSGKMWYAFSVAMADIYQDFRHKRLCMRIWRSNPDNVNVLVANGQIALMNGRYRPALAIFLLVYNLNSGYRYDSFYIGLGYLHLIMQSHTMDKCTLVTQMLTFFNDYVRKIGKCQESYYNLGRVYHQLGFYHHATEMYMAALETPIKIHDKRFDLTPEIAFNLSQIYRQCGAHWRANQLLKQYCTI